METGEKDQTRVRSFPTPESNMYKILTDPEYHKAFQSRVKGGNKFMAPMYKLRILPLFGMGSQIMLLATRGRKSGKMRDTPIGYVRIDNTIHIFSGWGKGADWFKNIQACPEEVFLQVGFKRFHARAEVVKDPVELETTLEHLVTQNPKGAEMLFGWDPQTDRYETSDFSMVVQKVLVVRFYPQ